MEGRILLNRYRIIQEIGRGGFGHTYTAIDLLLPSRPRKVVKYLCPKYQDLATLKRAKVGFKREAENLERLGQHNSGIPYLDCYFEEDDEFFLVQELIEGENLVREFKSGKKWGETKTVAFLQELLEILSVVHQNNTVHRDLKPANIMRRRRDGSLVLIDFGAVKQVVSSEGNDREPSTSVAGTPTYMAPEQAVGISGTYNDIYAVGILGIRALTGLTSGKLYCFNFQELEQLWIEHGVEVSPQLKSVLATMIDFHPENRYANAADALDALTATVAVSPPKSKVTPSNKRTNKSTLIKLLLACLGVGIAGTGIYRFIIFLQQPSPPRIETNSQNERTTVDDVVPPSQQLNYDKLETYLQNKEWEKANAETDRLILSLAGEDNALDINSAKKISCESLLEIDELWMNNSDELFGYTPQLAAYKATGNKFDRHNQASYNSFGQKVLWKEFGDWREYDRLNFNPDNKTRVTAPGHLPAPGIIAPGDSTSRDDNEPRWLLSRFNQCLEDK